MTKKHHAIKHKFFYLFLALMLFFISNAIFDELSLETFNAVFLIILVAASMLTLDGYSKPLLALGLCLGIAAALISSASDIVTVPKTVQILRISLLLAYFLGIMLICLCSTLEKKRVTANVLYGAVVTYLLIGLVFSNIYWLIDVCSQGAFNFHHSSNIHTPWQIFTYYSFVTLTTLGYGDITPVSNIARTFAWIEAAMGQVYLTILIAQLVGSFIAQKGKME